MRFFAHLFVSQGVEYRVPEENTWRMMIATRVKPKRSLIHCEHRSLGPSRTRLPTLALGSPFDVPMQRGGRCLSYYDGSQ